MITVGIFDAKKRLFELIERAARGEEVVITRRGVPVAKLLMPDAMDRSVEARSLAHRIRQARTPLNLDSGVSLRQLMEEGRR